VCVLVICILYSEVFLNLNEVLLTLTEVFPCFFLSCKPNAWVKLAKTGPGPHSTTLVCICVVPMLLFVLFSCFLCCSIYFLCVNVYCHRVTTQLQLIKISIGICHTGYSVCLLAGSGWNILIPLASR
jgi:hypothetical protein